MEALSGKKALIILTNEAFLPKSGRAHRRNPHNGMAQGAQNENGPAFQESPSCWTAPQPTIMEPPANYNSIDQSEATFRRGHERTGVDVFELGYLWMHLKRHYKMELTFCTPRGGPVAADPLSVERMEKDSKLKDDLKDERDFISRMGHTLPINWIKPSEFKVVILLGGHGAMFDLPEHDDIACCVAEVYRNNGIVAAMGHGVAGLLNVKMERRSHEYLIKDKRITCFSKEEERKLGYEEYLPFVLEDKLKERGAKVDIKKPFEPNVCMEERLITAQNPPSIQEFIHKITEAIRRI